jgi:DNA-directed RNA polymerase specialized sigma24 family protein
MDTQGPHSPCQAAAWDPNRLTAGLAIARRHAERGARRLSLPRADRDDLSQDILVVLLERSARFDPDRANWEAFATVVARHAVSDCVRARRGGARPVFVDIDLDSFPTGASATQFEQVDPDVALDLTRVGADMPAPCRDLLDLIWSTADVAEAQRHARQSSAAFYRALGELRCWLHAGGLRPPALTSVRASSTGTL